LFLEQEYTIACDEALKQAQSSEGKDSGYVAAQLNEMVVISTWHLIACACITRATGRLKEFSKNPLEHFELESRMSRYFDEWVSKCSVDDS
jgi:hypothetical protein